MDYLIEFGIEEIPAKVCDSIRSQLKNSIVNNNLQKHGITVSKFNIYVTPRRFAIILEKMDLENKEKYVIGPKVSDALNGERMNPIGKSFALNNKMSIRKLKKVKIDDVEYLCFVKDIKEIFSKKLEKFSIDLFESIQFQNKMRWNETDIEFIRPLRWITTVLDTVTISFEYAGITASTLTFGARFSGSTKIRIKTPTTYVNTLKNYGVIVDTEERKNIILNGIKQIEKEKRIKVNINEQLINQNANLVEFPKVIVGNFDIKYLQLPEFILTEILSKHLKSFSCNKNNKLSNYFVSIINQKISNENIISGWKKVIEARLSDALFYYKQDKGKDIETFKNQTKEIVVHDSVGSLMDVTNKAIEIGKVIIKILKVSSKDQKDIIEAINYSNFDLCTSLGKELPYISGMIGALYYNERGKSKVISDLIAKSTLPRFEGDELPNDIKSSIVSLSIKLTYLISYINAGLKIKGSFDPYGIRRLISSIIRIFIINNLAYKDIFTDELLTLNKMSKENISYLEMLFKNKIENIIKENGYNLGIYDDIINMSLVYDLNKILKDAEIINSLYTSNEDWFNGLNESRKRIVNIIKNEKVNKSKVSTKSNKMLYQSITETQKNISNIKDYSMKLKEISKLNKVISKYFDDVMVNDKDKSIKNENYFVLNEYLNLFIY